MCTYYSYLQACTFRPINEVIFNYLINVYQSIMFITFYTLPGLHGLDFDLCMTLVQLDLAEKHSIQRSKFIQELSVIVHVVAFNTHYTASCLNL